MEQIQAAEAGTTVSWGAEVAPQRTELIAEARWFTSRTLAGAPAALAGPAKLVVSELVTNACKYAPGPCRLDITLDAGGVELVVSDASPVLASALPPAPERVGQHGLEIVRALASAYRTERVPGGKSTTVRIAAPAPPGP